MKKLVLAILVLLAGCASNYEKYAEIHIANAQAEAARFKAMEAIAESGDTTTKVAAMFALQRSGNGAQNVIAAPKTASEQILQWLGVLAPVLVQGYGIHANQQIATTQSNNATALGISTNQAFVGMASQIQAPAANVITTLSGSGVIGAGTQTTNGSGILGAGTQNTVGGTGAAGGDYSAPVDYHGVTTTNSNNPLTCGAGPC